MHKKIIQTKDLSKTYKRYKKETGIKGSIVGLWKREYEEKKAVNDLNITMEEGAVEGTVVLIVFSIFTNIVWKRGLKHYNSASS